MLSKSYSWILLFLFTTVLFSQNLPVINPFGGMKWDDDLFVVIEKLNKIEGVETFNSQMGLVLGTFDLTKVKTREDLKNTFIKAYMQGKERNSKFPNKVYKIQNVPAFNAEGEEIRILRYDTIEMVLEPVVISGIPFQMIIRCNGARGLGAKNIDKLLLIDLDVYASFILDEVILSSDSPLISTKQMELYDLFSKHYKKYYDSYIQKKPLLDMSVWRNGEINHTCDDGKGASVSVLLNSNRCSLKFKNVSYADELEKAYRILLRKNEESKLKGKKGNSNLFGK